MERMCMLRCRPFSVVSYVSACYYLSLPHLFCDKRRHSKNDNNPVIVQQSHVSYSAFANTLSCDRRRHSKKYKNSVVVENRHISSSLTLLTTCCPIFFLQKEEANQGYTIFGMDQQILADYFILAITCCPLWEKET